MSELFNTIEDFINYKDNCIFCNEKLNPVITTYSSISNLPFARGLSLSDINSEFIDNKFIFNIKFTSARTNIDIKVNLDITSNELNMDTYMQPIVAIFQDMMPHIDLECVNKKCKMKYYISSGSFKFIENKVKPLILFTEGFILEELTIRNMFGLETQIYVKSCDKPITIPSFIKFDSLNKEALTNKIRTYVNFS